MTEEKLYRVARTHSDYINKYHKYTMCSWEDFDYEVLTRNIMYYRKKGKFRKGSWNDIIIAADTETTKRHLEATISESKPLESLCGRDAIQNQQVSPLLVTCHLTYVWHLPPSFPPISTPRQRSSALLPFQVAQLRSCECQKGLALTQSRTLCWCMWGFSELQGFFPRVPH